MNKILKLSVFLLTACVLGSAMSCLAEVMPPPGPPITQGVGVPPIGMNAPAISPIERVGKGVIRVGKVTVNKNIRSISFPAQINMTQGLLEYVLVRTGGKTHESLFRTETEPYDIQLACILLDLIGTDKPLPYQGAQDIPKGDHVAINVSFLDKNGKVHEIQTEKLVTKFIDGKPVVIDSLKWIYVGSWVNDSRFMAQVDGSIIALYHDPVAIFDNASPGGESDKIWFVNEKTVPPVGTPVTITIKAVK